MNSRQQRQLVHALRKTFTAKAPIDASKSPLQNQLIRPLSQAESPQSKTPVFRRLSLLRSLEVCAVVATLIAFAYQLRPNIAVQVDSTLNDAQPFATPFKFTNTGVLSLRDLRFTVALNTRQLRTLPGREIRLLPMPEIADLLPGDSVTEFIPIAFGKGEGNPAIRLEGGVAPVDMKFFAHFKVAVWPFLITRSFRFVTIGDLSGHLRWFQVPVNDTRDWIDTK